MTFKFNWFCAIFNVHVHAKYHQADYSGSSVIVDTSCFAIFCNGKEYENPILWPWIWPTILKFSAFWAVVKTYVPAQLHQAQCSGSWAIVVTENKKRIQSITTSVQTIIRETINDIRGKPVTSSFWSCSISSIIRFCIVWHVTLSSFTDKHKCHQRLYAF